MAFAAQRAEPANKAKVSDHQKRLWKALDDYVRHHGGAVVSVPFHKNLRIEIPKDSALASKLSEAGYRPFHCGMTTRITANGFSSVDVIEIDLPL